MWPLNWPYPNNSNPTTQPEPPKLTLHERLTLSPYRHLGLWRNPFGELTPDERAELAVVETASLLAFLEQTQTVVQFLGDCGFGKTTHLLALRMAIHRRSGNAQTASEGIVYFPEGGPRPSIPNGRPLFIDEAQRMSWLQRQNLLRRAGPIVLTSHSDLSAYFLRAGFQVLSVNVGAAKSPQQLAEILNLRLDASRLARSHEPTDQRAHFPAASNAPHCRNTLMPRVGPCVCAPLAEPYCAQLLNRFGSNLRRMEEYLYETIQWCVWENQPWPPAS